MRELMYNNYKQYGRMVIMYLGMLYYIHSFIKYVAEFFV